MKKHVHFTALLIVAAFAPIAANAQNTAPYWSLTGNSNATTSSKLGTTNNIPLRLFTNNAERLRIDGTGKIGIGGTNPTGKLTIFSSGGTPAASWVTSGVPIFAGFGENTPGNADHILGMASNSPSARAVFLGRKSRGTLAAPAALQNNDYLLSLYSSGYDGSSFQAPATVDFIVDGTVSGGAVPARISLSTGSGFSNRVERLKVGSTGNIDINNGQLYVQQATGAVGIGTNQPVRKLQVQNGDLRLETSLSNPHYLEFVRLGASIDWRMEHAGSGRYLYFSYSTNDFVSFTDKVVFDTAATTSGYSLYHYGKATGYAWDLFSDGKLKKDVSGLSDAVKILAKLQPKTYHFKQDEYATLHLPSQKQYGLIAQELEKVLPELVSTGTVAVGRASNGERKMEEVKSVNYIGIIPLLIRASQEQETHLQQQDSIITLQQAQINELRTLVERLSGGESIHAGTGYGLGQNTPNPGNNSTNISVNIPQGAHQARLAITDNAGKTLKVLQLTNSGIVNVNIAALAGGIYHYSLIVDNRVVDTRQMIIAR